MVEFDALSYGMRCLEKCCEATDGGASTFGLGDG